MLHPLVQNVGSINPGWGLKRWERCNGWGPVHLLCCIFSVIVGPHGTLKQRCWLFQGSHYIRHEEPCPLHLFDTGAARGACSTTAPSMDEAPEVCLMLLQFMGWDPVRGRPTVPVHWRGLVCGWVASKLWVGVGWIRWCLPIPCPHPPRAFWVGWDRVELDAVCVGYMCPHTGASCRHWNLTIEPPPPPLPRPLGHHMPALASEGRFPNIRAQSIAMGKHEVQPFGPVFQIPSHPI